MTILSSHPVEKTLTAETLTTWLRAQARDKSDWKIGTEHEKFLFHKGTFRPVAYEGEQGIGALLEALRTRYNMRPIMEHDNIIGLLDDAGGSITLEPGGQFELSGAPLKTLHQTCKETGTHLKPMMSVTAELELCMLGTGFQPLWGRDDCHWMPKGRYRIMRDYMQKKGSLGLDMMLRTCTVQVNLDFASEQDMVRKFRSSLALQPVATALFANSPFKDGVPSGLQSTRAHVWTDTDPDRCGIPACVFDPNFGYEMWIEYLLDVPMYFLHRGDDYLDVSGLSFRDFMDGRLPGFEGQYPDMHDFQDHMTTAFPEVRLKGYLEMRGADSGGWSNICALPAFWVGLLYDEQALDETCALVEGVSALDVEQARMSACRDGLSGMYDSRSMMQMASACVEIAEAGLARRAEKDADGEDETKFLAPLKQIVSEGRTLSDIMLEKYQTNWDGDITHLFREYHY
jgi:glutamate--cysteine ligase